MAANDQIDWSKSNEAVTHEVVREAEAYIAGQVTLATSADQRASVMASVFTAAGAALVAGLITLASTDHPASRVSVFLGGGVAAAFFLIGAALCVLATMPVIFHLPGGEPKNWRRDIESGRLLLEALQEQAINFQDKINANSKVLVANAKKFRWGAILGICAPLAGLVVWFLASVCRFVG